MTDFRVLEIRDDLEISECPKCGSTEIIVHKDLTYRVNVKTETVTEPSAYEDPAPPDITNVRCAKCGTLVGDEQDLVVFGSAIKERLKDELGRDSTEEEFLAFWNYLDTDVPQWLTDNVNSWMRAKAEEGQAEEEE